MPRYFFNVHDGSDLRDDVGTELPDERAARVSAVEMAGEMIEDEAHSFWAGEEWTMEVSDGEAVLFTLRFSMTKGG